VRRVAAAVGQTAAVRQNHPVIPQILARMITPAMMASAAFNPLFMHSFRFSTTF